MSNVRNIKKRISMSVNNSFVVLAIALAFLTTGCANLFPSQIVPETPREGSTLSIQVVFLKRGSNESFAHFYEFPNMLKIMIDDNGKFTATDSNPVEINEQDINTVYRQAKLVIEKFNRIEYAKLDTGNNALLIVKFKEGDHWIELSHVIEIPLDSNPREIKNLISACNTCAKKTK
jgi:hypothetical protein